MMIQSFADLIAVGLSQPEPQALLFVFLRAKEVEDGGAGTRGVLVPAMYTDKLLDAPVFGFAELAAEADRQGAPWDLVMTGALPGRGGQPPAPTERETALQTMLKLVQGGGNLSNYLFFDRGGEPVRLSSETRPG